VPRRAEPPEAPDDGDPRHSVRPPLDGPDPSEPAAPDGCDPACGAVCAGGREGTPAPDAALPPAVPRDGAPGAAAAPVGPAPDPPEPPPVGAVAGGTGCGAANGTEAGDAAETADPAAETPDPAADPAADPPVVPPVDPVTDSTVPPAGGAMPHSSQNPSSPTVPEQSGWVHRVIAPPPPRSPAL
jgi:hypothetical protein